MIFLAAIHDELLREPDDELAAYYPTVGGRRAPDAALGPALERFCAAREERLAHTLATRRTQTNETARCAGLLPAFAAVAGGRPLAQIEIGASAGLNGLWDHYAYDYAGTAAGDPDSPLRIACELRGGAMPPLDPPPVAWRAGIDLSPVDLRDPDDVRWLRACLWPDQRARHERFDAAVEVARVHGPVDIRRGDALAMLPGVIESAPAGALLCVFHTAALAYFTREQIADLARAARGARARRRLGRRRGARPPRRATRARPARRCTSRSRRGGRAGSRRSRAWATTAAGSSGRGLGVLALEAAAGVADHVAAAGEVDDPADLAADVLRHGVLELLRSARRSPPRRGGRAAAARRR